MKTLTTDKSLNISLTEKEFRQLIFLGNLGAQASIRHASKIFLR